MDIKLIYRYIILLLSFFLINFSSATLLALEGENSAVEISVNNTDDVRKIAGSLTFHIEELVGSLANPTETLNNDTITFTEEEISSLWQRLDETLDKNSFLYQLYLEGNLAYCAGIVELEQNKSQLAKDKLTESFLNIYTLWQEINENDSIEALKNLTVANQKNSHLDSSLVASFINTFQETKGIDIGKVIAPRATHNYNNFDNNPYISSSARSDMRPHLLPLGHAMKPPLDTIFGRSRAIFDTNALNAAGFNIRFVQPRSYIIVASHPQLSGYLLKLYLDSEMKLKRNKPGWSWFVKRCEGAKQVKKTIVNKNIQNFKVANKWIYPLPIKPYPKSDSIHKRKTVVLLVQDMNLTSKIQNLKAWKTVITVNHLKELHLIISSAKGSSYRPDNINYSRDGKFAFIDTEYPQSKPDYKSIRRFLSPSMRSAWDRIVKNGG